MVDTRSGDLTLSQVRTLARTIGALDGAISHLRSFDTDGSRQPEVEAHIAELSQLHDDLTETPGVLLCDSCGAFFAAADGSSLSVSHYDRGTEEVETDIINRCPECTAREVPDLY